MYVTVPHPTLAPLTPLSRPSPHPTPRGFRRREAERAVLKDARHPEPRSRLGGRGVTLRRGRCQVCLFKGRRRVLGSVTMAWKLAVFVFMLWNQVTVTTGETTCRPDEYEVPGNPSCSRVCPAGYYVSRPVSQDHPIGACSPCEPGTFRAHPSVETQCLPCAQCREDQEVVKPCSPTSDQECQCRQGKFFCDSVDCAESCIRCEDSAVLQPCNATSDAVCATNPQSGNLGSPWACMGVDVHICTTLFFIFIIFFIVIFIIGSIAIRYFVVSRRRTGSRNMPSGYSPGTGQSSDLENGPPAPGGDTSLELMNSALLASKGPGSTEPLQRANGSLAAPGEPGEQTRILEAARTTANQSQPPPLMSRSRSSDQPQCDESNF
ncbi:tumor necrosis factor receptor superfamily member 1A-like [Cervus canadensis]|uniref:tumor necrosis factor receptor superfamily member 1A-like n=1 Tax=Cervus canadensis TaxID=1574408 RepID=UPI001CA30192|nr:tumor necrosis factor receptor superfamily member 1A-like [Cervus canadensis]